MTGCFLREGAGDRRSQDVRIRPEYHRLGDLSGGLVMALLVLAPLLVVMAGVDGEEVQQVLVVPQQVPRL